MTVLQFIVARVYAQGVEERRISGTDPGPEPAELRKLRRAVLHYEREEARADAWMAAAPRE